MADILDELGVELPQQQEQKSDILDEMNVDVKPPYARTPTETYGAPEKIFIQNQGKTVDAPAGTGKVFDDILQNDAFDHGGDPSTTLEETEATLEKQGAYFALLANAYGLIGDDEAAPFVADRSKALKNAQLRAPEYMKRFNEQWQSADGFFAGAGVIMDNPRALGRMTVTQLPNSLFPLITSYAGMKAGAGVGALTGAGVGSAVPVAGTAAGAAVGTTVGGVVGAGTGAFIGSSMQEVGSQLDELLSDAGYDMTDANSVLAALRDDQLMSDVRKRAERKGITTATVDAFFTMFGGKFLRVMEKSGKVGKVAGGAADMAVQSVGEFSSEAAGQYARDQKVDWKDAALEGITSMGQSVGDTAIGYSARTGRAAINIASDKIGSTTPEARAAADAELAVKEFGEASIAETQAQDIAATEIEGVPQEQVADIVQNFMEGVEPDTSQFDDAQAAAIQDVLDKAKPVRDKIVRGRVRKLDTDIEAKLSQIDALEADIAVSQDEGRGTKRKEARLNKLMEEWMSMDEERGDLMTVSDQVVAKTASGKMEVTNETLAANEASNKEITVKGSELSNINASNLKRSVMAVNSAFREARIATKVGIKNVQKSLSAAIRNSGLDAKSQAEFIGTITSLQTKEQLKAQAPKIQARIEAKINDQRKKTAIGEIKSLLKRVNNSGVIAIDYVNKINDMFSEIDLRKRSQKTTDSLQSTLDYVQREGKEGIPKEVLQKLDRLNKKNIDDISASDLEDMANTIRDLVDTGRTKLKLMQRREERIKQQRLLALEKDSVKLSDKPLRRAPLGERMAIMDTVRNKFTDFANYMQRLNINKNPMDVIFDLMDGGKQYKGANHTIFKQTIDTGFHKYLDLKESVTRSVKDLQDKLKLTEEQFEKIGVYAAAQQEDGIEKLMATGFSRSEVENLTLTPEEKQMYDLMREKLDSMVPQLREIMRVTYNKNFDEVENYFPFMTDFDAMDGYEVQDMFGQDAPQVAAKKKNVEKGFTVSRKGGKQKIRIDALNVFLKHTDNAAYLVGLGSEIRQLSNVATSEEFGMIAGDVGQDIVTDWLNLLARKGSLPETIRGMDALRRNTGAAVLGFKLSSIFIQPTSLMDGASLVGGTYVGRGISDITKKEWRVFLKENFAEIRERAGDDPAYMDLGGGVMAKAREAGYWALQNVDLLSASAVAAGAYRRAVEESGGVVDLNNPDPEAIRIAQLYMRRTQSSGFAKDAAPILSQGKLTGNVSVDKLILQFQSFVLNRWSIIQHDMVGGLRQGRTKQAMNIATWLIIANVSENFIRHWTKEMVAMAMGVEPPEDDKDDTVADEIVAQAIGNMPVVGSIVNSFQYGSVPIPAVSLVEKITESMAYGNKSKTAEKKARHYGSAAILTAGMFGVPAALQTQQIYSGAMKEYVIGDGKKKSSASSMSSQ